MSFASEFKEFAVKGNVVDLAVGVIIGAAFGKIVESFVADIIMPIIGRFTGGIDFTNMFVALTAIPPGIPATLEAVRKAGVPVIAYGNFINIIFNFVILALVVFLMVKQINRLRRNSPKPPPAEDVLLLREIRDNLSRRSEREGRRRRLQSAVSRPVSRMRKLWLVFAQAVTLTLAVLFVVSLVKPDWLAWRAQVVEVREAAPAAGQPAIAQPVSPLRGPLSFADAAKKAIPSVVNISATRQVRRRNPLLEDPAFQRFFGERFQLPPETQLSLGSGVIVSRDGYILTNDHVVEGVTDIQVTTNDGRTLVGKVVGTDPETDLAVVRINAPGLTAVTFGQSEQARVGDVVLAIGDPFSVGQTVTMGIISAVGREIGSANPFGSFIQTDAAINPGNSGGALVDTSGNLIGINTLIFSRSGGYQGIGFAIPVSLAKRVLEQIIETGTVTRGWFGVDVADITPELAESLGLKGTRGAIVGAIERGSPAEKSGMKLGDVIVAVNGRAVANTSAALAAIAEIPPGQSVPVRVVRRNQELGLDVMVGKRRARPRTEE